MQVAAAVFDVRHHDPGMAGEAESGLQPVDGIPFLLRGQQRDGRVGIDIGVVKRLAAARTGSDPFHLLQTLAQIPRR